MKIFRVILRIVLGLMLLTFGLNKFLWFMPDFDFTGYPEAEHLFNALRYSGDGPDAGKGYIMCLTGITEIVVGILLVVNKWVPFALVAFVPISINIVLFHAFVNLPNIGPAMLVVAINAYLIHRHRESYRTLFS